MTEEEKEREPYFSPATSGLPEWLQGLRLAEPQSIGNLVLVPLVNGPAEGPRYLTQHEAAKDGILELVEQGAGNVQNVEARNHGRTPILILEGDILIGAKQNRVVARSVLVPAGKRCSIPVGCVEQGRWSRPETPFASGDFSAETSLRKETVKEANEAVASGHAPRLNQVRLWGQVHSKLLYYKTKSRTASYQAMLSREGPRARHASTDYVVGESHLGVLALWKGALLGLELVGHPETWKGIARRRVPSLVLEAEAAEFDEASRPTSGTRSAEEWLAVVSEAPLDPRPAIGLGDDVALGGATIAGACLWHEGRPAHLAAFGS